MGLYDREYVRNSAPTTHDNQEVVRGERNLSKFIAQTYQLFAATLISGAAGAYVGVGMASVISANYWWIAIPWMIFGMFGLNLVKNKPGINYIVLFAFTFVGGMILGPLISSVLGMSNGSTLVANAFISTAVIFGALSIYAMNTKSDFSSWGKPLMIAFIVAIVVALVNMFVFKSPILHVAFLVVFMMIISAMVLYDTQNIIRGLYETPIDGAIALYLDFFNMFSVLLQMFGIFGGDD